MSDDRQHAPDTEDARRRLARTFQRDLTAAEAEAASFEDVAAYVEGRLQGDALHLFDERLASDALLQAEVADLRALRGEIEATRRGAPGWMRWAAAAALVAAIVGGWLFLRTTPQPARTPAADGGRGSELPPTASGSPASATLLRLTDESGPIALLADGTVQGVPATLRAPVAEALRSGRLRIPPLRDDLAVSAVTAMGSSGPQAAFGPIAPLSTLVFSDRPRLRWSRHPDARGYVVSVYDLDLAPVAESPRLDANDWTPERPLPRGRTYLWQVEAITPTGRVAGPAPPAAEARFHVASAAAEREIRDVLAEAGTSRLAAGIALAERGFLDEAASELEGLAGRNPGSPEIKRLRDALDAHRRR